MPVNIDELFELQFYSALQTTALSVMWIRVTTSWLKLYGKPHEGREKNNHRYRKVLHMAGDTHANGSNIIDAAKNIVP